MRIVIRATLDGGKQRVLVCVHARVYVYMRAGVIKVKTSAASAITNAGSTSLCSQHHE